MSENAPQENQPPFDPPVSAFAGPVGELIAQRMLAPPPRPGVLATVDHYEVLRLLGGGGMGVVLLARDQKNNREVAIKLVKSELVSNPNAIHRFLKETGHLKRLHHSNIVPVEEISDRSEGPYFVMPYFEKGSLASRIKPGQPLDTETILNIAIPIAEGLSFAHRSGIIHRDLKPANILLGAENRVALADFGLARTMFNDTIVDVESRQLEGTAPYVSPAIAAGDAEDTRCDIYSFGALLYEMLTGLPPYQGRGTKEILDQILAGPPKPILSVNPDADRGLVAVAEGCMARELRDRYADMRDVLKDLQRVRHDEEPVGQRGASSRRTQKILLLALWIAGIALLASASWLFLRERSELPKLAANDAKTNSSSPVVTPPAIASTNAATNETKPTVADPSPAPSNAVVVALTNTVVPTNSNAIVSIVTNNAPAPTPAPATNIVTQPTEPIVIPPPPTQSTAPVQPVVADVARLAANGLSDTVLSNYIKSNPPASPLTTAEADYLRTNKVSPNIIALLRGTPPALASTNQNAALAPGSDVHALVKNAYALYEAHQNQEAIDFCNQALKLDPQNPDAWCVKAVSSDALHHTADAMLSYSTFLKLSAAQTPQYASWHTYAATRLKALRGW